jgi:hypothetical protein
MAEQGDEFPQKRDHSGIKSWRDEVIRSLILMKNSCRDNILVTHTAYWIHRTATRIPGAQTPLRTFHWVIWLRDTGQIWMQKEGINGRVQS